MNKKIKVIIAVGGTGGTYSQVVINKAFNKKL